MANTISLETILDMLKPLSASNKRWLADKLYSEAAKEKKTCELDKALEEAHTGKLTTYNSVEDFFQKMGI